MLNKEPTGREEHVTVVRTVSPDGHFPLSHHCCWKQEEEEEDRITQDGVHANGELSPQDQDGLLPFSVENERLSQTAETADETL